MENNNILIGFSGSVAKKIEPKFQNNIISPNKDFSPSKEDNSGFVSGLSWFQIIIVILVIMCVCYLIYIFFFKNNSVKVEIKKGDETMDTEEEDNNDDQEENNDEQ